MTVSVAELIVRLNDQASANGEKIAKSLGKIADSEKAIGANSAGMHKLTAELNKADAALKKMGDFREAQKGFAAARAAFNDAKKNVEELARKVAEADKPTRDLANSFKRAQAAVKAASTEFERQKSAILSAKSAMAGMGVSVDRLAASESKLKSSIDTTTAALKRQAAAEREAASARSRAVGGGPGIGGALGAIGGSWFAQMTARKAITSAAEFDIAARRQVAVMGVGEADQKSILIPQAKKIGQETPFSNLDVIKAQTSAMQGLPNGIAGRLKAEVGAGIVENVKHYALIMETDLAEASETVRSFLTTTGKDISTKAKALHESQKAVNQIVKMAKIGGMSKEDVPQFLKFGMATSAATGITPESAMSIAALARIGGLKGDEAGVMMRAVASKLVAPDRPGMVAMEAAGINYNKYRKMPDRLESGNLENTFKRELGTSFTPAIKAKLDRLLADKATLGDQGSFTASVTDAVSDLFPKTKKGQMSAAHKQRIAATLGRFYKASAGSVDAQGALDDIMSSNMSIAQLNALFTSKHGGKFTITQKQREEYLKNREEIKKSGDTPDMARNMSEYMYAGLGGSLENLKGSVDNAVLSLGQAHEGWLKPLMDTGGKLLDGFSSLSKETQIAATAMTAAGMAALYYARAQAVGNVLNSLPGGPGAVPGAKPPGPVGRVVGGVGRFLGPVAGLAGVASLIHGMVTNPPDLRNKLQGPDGPRLANLNNQISTLELMEKRGVNDPRLRALRGQRNEIQGRQMLAEDANPFIPLPGMGESKGTQAGAAAGQGIASGLQSAAGGIAAQAEAIYESVRAKFASPISINVQVKTEGLRGVHADAGVSP